MTTAWDGYSRVEYLPDEQRLLVTVTTLEPTVYQRFRDGLAAMFVADDPYGPPTFLDIDLRADLDGELPWLLGSRLAPVVRAIVDDEPHGVALQLGVEEIAELAEHWAPYRANVLAGADESAAEHMGARVGTWAHGLWTRLASRDLLDAVAAALATPRPATGERGAAAPSSWETVDLPPELAAEAGVRPAMRWRTFLTARPRIKLRTTLADPARQPEMELIAGFDDGRSPWVPFRSVADPAVLEAVLGIRPGHDQTGIRLRTRRIGDA